MKNLGMQFGVILATAAVLASTMVPPALAADLEFDALVSSIERRYQVRHEHIPLLGFASFCAWIYTRGGVKGLRVADFEDTDARISTEDIDSFVQGKLGASWNVILRSHEKENKNDTIIYVRSSGDKFVMLIAEVEKGQLSLVKLRVNANSLSRWVNDQERHSEK
jgi:hypothetical protein